MGDSMAHCNAQPRLTHSLAFMVREGSFPKKDWMRSNRAGKREEPPTSSTLLMSSTLRPAWSSAACSGLVTRLRMPAASSSNLSRVRWLLTSWSSMMHSTLSGASGLALRIFFSFSQAARKRSMARALLRTSSFLVAMISSAKWLTMTLSKSAPPRLRSHADDITRSLPFCSAITHTWSAISPTSTMTVWMGLSSGRSVL
mmetsp:Transcript_24915/g.62673  ORF Transcript_24915/g.62673 Transcript_24915/m.62673 type:complete len:200 (-) Transcript_24915:668-1267(-)